MKTPIVQKSKLIDATTNSRHSAADKRLPDDISEHNVRNSLSLESKIFDLASCAVTERFLDIVNHVKMSTNTAMPTAVSSHKQLQ